MAATEIHRTILILLFYSHGTPKHRGDMQTQNLAYWSPMIFQLTQPLIASMIQRTKSTLVPVGGMLFRRTLINPSYRAPESRKSSSDDQRHKLSTAYPGWSPDIDSSQEKLDRSPVGMPITHILDGSCLTEESPVALCFESRAKPPDKELPENSSDSDFEDWSGPQKDYYTFEFGTSTLQFDSDSGSSSTASDGHEIIAFEGMGSQRLTPLSPCPSISSEEHNGLGAILMDFGGDCSDEGGVTAPQDDYGFLVIDFE